MSDKRVINAIVLRFRDKGENVVDTIEEHDKYIRKVGYVWWGWWAKGHELSPYDYFGIIDKNIKSRNPTVKFFLLHTKTKRLYEAICTEIKYSEKSEDSAILTPDPEATPSYYNKVNAKLWLKFTKITETSQSLLLENHYSFLPDSNFFFNTERKENHLIASFADCKVSKIDEFILQDRTIWFLRTQKSSDRDTNIDEWLPLPDNFAKHHTHARQGAYKLLVLSDLHLMNGSKHNFSLSNDADYEKITLLESLENAIMSSSIGGYDKIAGIIIAGDFVFHPSVEEFDLAKAFVKELLERAELKPEQLAIVPGNHDIAYLPPTRSSTDSDTPDKAIPEATKLFRDFYEGIFNANANNYLCSSRKIKLPNELQIEIICVNSCVLQQEEDYFVQGYVGEAQWDEIKTQLNLRPDVQTYTYRILLLHHHLMSTSIYSEKPLRGKNYNILLDAGSVSHNVRKYNIKLVIHGHGHESGHDYSAPRKKMGEKSAPNSYDVISMGSAGSSDLPSGEKNTFGILDFSVFGKVKFEKYALATTKREKHMNDPDKPIESWEMPVFEIY